MKFFDLSLNENQLAIISDALTAYQLLLTDNDATETDKSMKAFSRWAIVEAEFLKEKIKLHNGGNNSTQAYLTYIKRHRNTESKLL